MLPQCFVYIYTIHVSDKLHAWLYRFYVVIWRITASIIPARVHKAVPWVDLIDSLIIYFLGQVSPPVLHNYSGSLLSWQTDTCTTHSQTKYKALC